MHTKEQIEREKRRSRRKCESCWVLLCSSLTLMTPKMPVDTPGISPKWRMRWRRDLRVKKRESRERERWVSKSEVSEVWTIFTFNFLLTLSLSLFLSLFIEFLFSFTFSSFLFLFFSLFLSFSLYPSTTAILVGIQLISLFRSLRSFERKEKEFRKERRPSLHNREREKKERETKERTMDESSKGKFLMEFRAGRALLVGSKVKPSPTKGNLEVHRVCFLSSSCVQFLFLFRSLGCDWIFIQSGSKIIFTWKSREKGASEGDFEVRRVSLSFSLFSDISQSALSSDFEKETFDKLETRQIVCIFSKIWFECSCFFITSFLHSISAFFQVTKEKHFFWMQDADESADAFILKKLRGHLSEPSPPAMLKLINHREELEPSPRGPLPPAATLDSPHSPTPASVEASGTPNARASGLSSSSHVSDSAPLANALLQPNLLQQILQNTLAQMGVQKDGLNFKSLSFSMCSSSPRFFR